MSSTFDSANDDLAAPDSLEHLLGRPEDRYFGDAYRHVRHRIVGTERASDDRLVATGNVTYPPQWSVADRGPARVPHLSSIDALVLPLMALEHAASMSDLELLARSRVASIELRGGSEPWVELHAVPIDVHVSGPIEALHLTGASGNIRLSMTLIQDETKRTVRAFAPDSSSVYDAAFRETFTRTTITALDASAGELYASHAMRAPTLPIPPSGIESSFWPAPTVIDYLVVMGQLTQALVYAGAGLTRSTAGPLWMRTMNIDLARQPVSLPAEFTTVTRVVRDRMLRRSDAFVHDVHVECVASSGVTARSTLAYVESSS